MTMLKKKGLALATHAGRALQSATDVYFLYSLLGLQATKQGKLTDHMEGHVVQLCQELEAAKAMISSLDQTLTHQSEQLKEALTRIECLEQKLESLIHTQEVRHIHSLCE